MICVTSLYLVFYCYILDSVIWDFNMTGNMRFVPLIGPHMFSFMTYEANLLSLLRRPKEEDAIKKTSKSI